MWICVITKKAILGAVLTWSSAITPCITGTFIALIIDQAISSIACITFIHRVVIDDLAVRDSQAGRGSIAPCRSSASRALGIDQAISSIARIAFIHRVIIHSLAVGNSFAGRGAVTPSRSSALIATPRHQAISRLTFGARRRFFASDTVNTFWKRSARDTASIGGIRILRTGKARTACCVRIIFTSRAVCARRSTTSGIFPSLARITRIRSHSGVRTIITRRAIKAITLGCVRIIRAKWTACTRR